MTSPGTNTPSAGSLRRPWELPVIGPLLIGLGVLLLSVFLVWGIKNFISGANKDYRELISDLESKSFGNKWISALELTKVLTQTKLSPIDQAWTLERLTQIYNQNTDERTRHFVIAAVGLLPNAQVSPLLLTALKDSHSQVQLRAIASLGQRAYPIDIELNKQLETMLENSQQDEMIQQAILLYYAQLGIHPNMEILSTIIENSSNLFSHNVRLAAALTLVPTRNVKATNLITEVFTQRNNEKWVMNFLHSFYKYPWREFQGIIEVLSEDKTLKNLEMKNVSREVLKKWGAT